MSYATHPAKRKRENVETEAAVAAKQQQADRDRIRRLLITLGDDTSKKVAGQIRGLAGAVEDDVELHGDLMADTVLECAKCLPAKASIYAAWVARMAEKHPAWAVALAPRLIEELRMLLRSGRTRSAQILLQFIAGLGNTGLLGLDEVFALLEEIAALSAGLRPAKGGDLGVYLALATLPFMSAAAHAKAGSRVETLLQGLHGYLSSRQARWTPILRFVKSQGSPDALEALQVALSAMKRAGWSSQCVRHVPGFEPSLESKVEGMTLPGLEMTSEDVKKSKVRLQPPLMATRLLTGAAESDGADDHMPSHDRWLVEELTLLTIDGFRLDVEECAKQLLRMPVLHPQFEAILVETIFAQMFRLPTPPELPLFYSSLLESIIGKQKSVKPLVEQYFAAVIGHAANLDEECLEVLAEVFAYHLSQNKYETDWARFAGGSVDPHSERLVRKVLDRLQRLSFHQNLMHRLPEMVHVYVPPEPEPATELSIQKKPEYSKMLGLVKIKDADEVQVVEFCEALQHGKAAESAAAGGEAAPAARAEQEKEGGEPPAKRQRAGAAPDEAALGGQGADALPVQPKEEEQEEGATENPAGDGAGSNEAAAAVEGGGAAADESAAADKPAQPPAEERGWELVDVVAVFVTALLHKGSKTPTHLSKLLDAYKGVFEKLRPTEEDEAYEYEKMLIRCVLEVWRSSSARVEITVAAFVERGLVSCRAAAEAVLAGRGPQGSDSLAAWSVINAVARKSLEQSQTARVELAMAKRLGKAEAADKCKAELDKAVQQSAELFTVVFTGLVRNYQDFEGDATMRQVMSQRVLAMGRKYHAFIKPLIDAAESRVPGVAHCPDMAAVFASLSCL